MEIVCSPRQRTVELAISPLEQRRFIMGEFDLHHLALEYWIYLDEGQGMDLRPYILTLRRSRGGYWELDVEQIRLAGPPGVTRIWYGTLKFVNSKDLELLLNSIHKCYCAAVSLDCELEDLRRIKALAWTDHAVAPCNPMRQLDLVGIIKRMIKIYERVFGY